MLVSSPRGGPVGDGLREIRAAAAPTATMPAWGRACRAFGTQAGKGHGERASVTSRRPSPHTGPPRSPTSRPSTWRQSLTDPRAEPLRPVTPTRVDRGRVRRGPAPACSSGFSVRTPKNSVEPARCASRLSPFLRPPRRHADLIFRPLFGRWRAGPSKPVFLEPPRKWPPPRAVERQQTTPRRRG